MTTRERMKELIEKQPQDATYEEIMRELAFARMVERGPADARKGRTISSKEMGRRIRAWQKSCGPKRPSAWLEDIYRYIARDDPDAAAQVIEGIYSKVQALAKFPEIGYR